MIPSPHSSFILYPLSFIIQKMSLSHTYSFSVPPSAIDANGHVNNVAYIQWMQDAAIAHADAVGCTAMTKALNATWVVRSHTIQYRLPAFLGDRITVKTWIADCRSVSSRRKYEFYRDPVPPTFLSATPNSTNPTSPEPPTPQPTPPPALLARGETDWVLLDLPTLHPKP